MHRGSTGRSAQECVGAHHDAQFCVLHQTQSVLAVVGSHDATVEASGRSHGVFTVTIRH